MQQQQQSFHNQQRPQRSQPLLQTPPSNQPPFSAALAQQATNNPNLSLQTQNPLGLNPLATTTNPTQQNSLDSWLTLYAAALNPQQAVAQQPQQDTTSLTQQWAQWLKTAQLVNKNFIFQSYWLTSDCFLLGSNSTTASTSINRSTSHSSTTATTTNTNYGCQCSVLPSILCSISGGSTTSGSRCRRSCSWNNK